MDVDIIKLEGGVFKGDPSANGWRGTATAEELAAWKKITDQGYDAKIPTNNPGEFEYVKYQSVTRQLDSDGNRGAVAARQELAHGAAFKIENGRNAANGVVWAGDGMGLKSQLSYDKMKPDMLSRRSLISTPVNTRIDDPALDLITSYIRQVAGIDFANGAQTQARHGKISNLQQHLNDVIGQPRDVDGVVGGKPKYNSDQLEEMRVELTKLQQEASDHVDELSPGPDGKRQPNVFTISADSGVVSPKGDFGTTIVDSAGNEKWLPGSSQRVPAGVMNHYCSVWEGTRALRLMEDAGMSASTMNAEYIAEAVHRGWGKSSALRNVDEVDLGTKLGKVSSENHNLGMQTTEQIKEFATTFENLAQSLNNPMLNNLGTPKRIQEQALELIDIFVDAGFSESNLFPKNHRSIPFHDAAQGMLSWLDHIGGAGSPMKWENGRYVVDDIPLPFGGTSIGVEYRKIDGPGGSQLFIPDTKVTNQRIVNSGGQGGLSALTFDTSNWKKYLEQMVKTNRAATQADSFSKLTMGDKVLDLPTVIVLLKQNPELFQTWMTKSGKTWDELQNMMVYRDPKTGDAVTLDLFIGANTTDAVTLNVPVKRGDSVEWLEVVLSPPKTVAEAPNGAVGGAKKEGWSVVLTKGSDESRFANSAITDIIRHGNIADNLLKLEVSKIFARGRFIEEFIKNLPGPNIGGALSNGAVYGLFFLAHSGFYQKILRNVSRGSNRATSLEVDGARVQAGQDAVSANWKWNTSMKPGVGLLFAPLSTWFNGYYHIGQEMLLNSSSSGASTSDGDGDTVSYDDPFLDRWNTAISDGAVEKGIPQDQMCSFFQYNEDAKFHLGVQFTWQMGQVGWALGMPLSEYVDYRIANGQPDDDPDEVSDWQEEEFDRIRDACLLLDATSGESTPEGPPIRYLVKTGEMGVPLHGTLVGNSEIMYNLSNTKAGQCWSKTVHDERKWGYYAEDDDDPDIELLSQDACYACWPAHFPEAFCKGAKGIFGGDDNLSDYPCNDNLEADTMGINGWDTASRYPGFNKNPKFEDDQVAMIDAPGDFTPTFDD
jgi:hypothetical protein